MASGGGGITQIIWLVVMLYILVEFVFPLGRKLIGSFMARRIQSNYTTVSYI